MVARRELADLDRYCALGGRCHTTLPARAIQVAFSLRYSSTLCIAIQPRSLLHSLGIPPEALCFGILPLFLAAYVKHALQDRFLSYILHAGILGLPFLPYPPHQGYCIIFFFSLLASLGRSGHHTCTCLIHEDNVHHFHASHTL